MNPAAFTQVHLRVRSFAAFSIACNINRAGRDMMVFLGTRACAATLVRGTSVMRARSGERRSISQNASMIAISNTGLDERTGRRGLIDLAGDAPPQAGLLEALFYELSERQVAAEGNQRV